MKPTIAYMHRVSLQNYLVVFSCSHRHIVRKHELDHMWFVGKAVVCRFCTPGKNKKRWLQYSL
jgi:hypothetical protein